MWLSTHALRDITGTRIYNIITFTVMVKDGILQKTSRVVGKRHLQAYCMHMHTSKGLMSSMNCFWAILRLTLLRLIVSYISIIIGGRLHNFFYFAWVLDRVPDKVVSDIFKGCHLMIIRNDNLPLTNCVWFNFIGQIQQPVISSH